MKARNTKTPGTGKLTASHSPTHEAEASEGGRAENSNWASGSQSERAVGDMNAHLAGNVSVKKGEIPKYSDKNHKGGEFMRSSEKTKSSIDIGLGKWTGKFRRKRSSVREIQTSQAMSDEKSEDQFAEVVDKTEGRFRRPPRPFVIQINIICFGKLVGLAAILSTMAKLYGWL